ncbi:alpha/beta hydrolase family protein [Streptomyces sp. adm13(2018)]|uniref:alpha/beta hydrolase family protein n=1 Tax=Streptomyces sp. adm13(2018) TaxID=2479007 RepID=UPI003967D73A
MGDTARPVASAAVSRPVPEAAARPDDRRNPMDAARFAADQWTRVLGAGVDPHEYQRVVAGLGSLAGWGPACAGAGDGHLRRAEDARSARSAGEHLLAAARWFHVATLAPYADAHRAARAADEAAGKALALLEPGARQVSGEGFTGWLRGPADAPGTVVVVPGLNSAKEEFLDLASALLARGLAVFAMDGPGQGVLAATSTFEADYERVVGRVADALGAARIGLVGMSLGGYFAARAAAFEPRVAAVATVSGPFRLDWELLTPGIRGLIAGRTGGAAQAREFTRWVDLTDVAPRITAPLLVVEGGEDVMPGVANSESLARLAPRGSYLTVPHGDHLLGNARPDWLPRLCDHFADALRGAPEGTPEEQPEAAGGPAGRARG